MISVRKPVGVFYEFSQRRCASDGGERTETRDEAKRTVGSKEARSVWKQATGVKEEEKEECGRRVGKEAE